MIPLCMVSALESGSSYLGSNPRKVRRCEIRPGCFYFLIAVQISIEVRALPELSWLEREAVNLKVGSSSLPGSRFV